MMMSWLATRSRQQLIGHLVSLLVLSSVGALKAEPVDSLESRPRLTASAAVSPAYCYTLHTLCKPNIAITNFGRMSLPFTEEPAFDCFTGKKIPMGEYPRGSKTVYLYNGGFWFGGIIEGDTLVSCGTEQDECWRELHPDATPYGDFERRSSISRDPVEAAKAVSEEDLIAVYTDTLEIGNRYASYDWIEQRPHQPLGIEVRQQSYTWSYEYADDFIMFDLRVTNISDRQIDNMYVGVYLDPSVALFRPPGGASAGEKSCGIGVNWGQGDIVGFMETYPTPYYDYCEFEDTIRLAWAADADGDWAAVRGRNATSGTMEAAHVTGLRFLRPPRDDERFSFNWWDGSFAPQLRTNVARFGYLYGYPYGDRMKFKVMANGEVDYDQLMTARISLSDPDWAWPNLDNAMTIAHGSEVSYLMSLGPYTLAPYEEVRVPVAFIGGESLHVDPSHWMVAMRFGRYYPEWYMYYLNFAPFAKNAIWAGRIYDNPGIDTDDDGYAGKMRFCVMDSIWIGGRREYTLVDTTFYEGDGVPDWRAEAPPPAPDFWLTPTVNGVKVRFNGYRSESARDFLTSVFDFEGYRVYVGRDEREASLCVAASYDRENYDAFAYNPRRKPTPGYELLGIPGTVDYWRCRFGAGDEPCRDTLFHPAKYSLTNPYRSPRYEDSVLYFRPHDNNTHRWGVDTPIQRRFPDEPKPVPGQPIPADAYTDDGYLKYYEYEVEIPRLLPTVPYYINVTAFDFGSPKAGLEPLESSRTHNLQSAYAFSSADQLGGKLPPAYVYPNPYRVDDRYRRSSWEGRAREQAITDRVRAIHFVNVPPTCTIRIHTLDGDLVREIRHEADPSDPKATHAMWDMISRNVQMIVSGIYYWTVEATDGTVQMGTFVVIM